VLNGGTSMGKPIVAQFYYFPGDLRRYKGIIIRKEDVEAVGAKIGVKVTYKIAPRGAAGPISALLFKHYMIETATITVEGDDEEKVKEAIREIVKVYGKPNVDFGMKGAKLVKQVVKEMGL